MGTKALNAKEQKVLDAFLGPGEPCSLEDLAKVCYRKKGIKPNTQGNSWIRNSLRALIKLELVEQVARGVYCRTERDYTLSDEGGSLDVAETMQEARA